MNSARPKAAGGQEMGSAVEEQPAASCSSAEVAGEAPALDFRQIRRAWEERFGPSRQLGAAPLRKRSLEGPSLSDSTSGCSSASFPASSASTPLLPSIGPTSGSTSAQAVPLSINRLAFEASGPSVDGSSPDAASRTALRAAAPLETSPVSVPRSQIPVSASRPVVSQFIDAPEQQETSSSGLDVSPDPDPALPHRSLELLSGQQTQQQPPSSRAGQHSSDSSEATIPSLLEAPDTATPSASEESLGDPNQADDSTFLGSRGTSLARTLSPEELALPEIPHSSSSGSALPEVRTSKSCCDFTRADEGACNKSLCDCIYLQAWMACTICGWLRSSAGAVAFHLSPSSLTTATKEPSIGARTAHRRCILWQAATVRQQSACACPHRCWAGGGRAPRPQRPELPGSGPSWRRPTPPCSRSPTQAPHRPGHCWNPSRLRPPLLPQAGFLRSSCRNFQHPYASQAQVAYTLQVDSDACSIKLSSGYPCRLMGLTRLLSNRPARTLNH